MPEETKDKVMKVVKSDMKTAELMGEMVDNHSNEDIGKCTTEVMEDLIGKIEDPVRERCMYATCFQIAQAIQDQQLAEFSARKLEQMEGGNGSPK